MYYQIGRTNLRLAGALHQVPADCPDLPGWVEQAYRWAEDIMLEHELNSADFLFAANGGSSLKEKLSPALWAQLHEVWRGSPLDRQTLWFVLIALSMMSPLRTVEGVEPKLVKWAARDKRQFKYLEAISDFVWQANAVPDYKYVRALEMLLANFQNLPFVIREMHSEWLVGRIHALEKLLPRTLLGQDETIRKVVLGDRNDAWMPKILEACSCDKPTLIVVGAMHLVGEKGLIRQLERQGAELTPLA